MASIDKIAMGVTVVIIAIALGITASMGAAQDAGPAVSTPSTISTPPTTGSTETTESGGSSFGADLAAKIRENAEQTRELEEEETMMEETIEEETMMEETTEPVTHIVEVPLGTSVPGCEETNSCFSPADITINAGDTIEWINVDTAAHTVTGGTPAGGPSGVFDSSLLMVDASFASTFEDTGSYDYFCMVHPWMLGTVTVN